MQEKQIQEEISAQDCKCLSSGWVLGPIVRTSFSSRDTGQTSVWFQKRQSCSTENCDHHPPFPGLEKKLLNWLAGFLLDSVLSSASEQGLAPYAECTLWESKWDSWFPKYPSDFCLSCLIKFSAGTILPAWLWHFIARASKIKCLIEGKDRDRQWWGPERMVGWVSKGQMEWT